MDMFNYIQTGIAALEQKIAHQGHTVKRDDRKTAEAIRICVPDVPGIGAYWDEMRAALNSRCEKIVEEHARDLRTAYRPVLRGGPLLRG